MNPSFSLVREPWIPVRLHGDEGSRELSLRDAIARAHEIAELADPSPLVTAALHRLLLAVCHRTWGPSNQRAWQQLWEARRFDQQALDAYLEQWAHRFDLFDPSRPFYQVPGLPRDVATTIAKLGHEFSAGNNPVLFDHRLDNAPRPLSPAHAARLLVALQAFAVGGLLTRLPGDPPSAEASHIFKAAVQVVTGRNLFETLLLNMVSLASEQANRDSARNVPAWEAEPPGTGPRAPAGIIDLLTWQPRRILLFPEPDGTVARVTILAGHSLPPKFEVHVMEPMVAYVKRDVKENQDPWSPVGFRPEEALWRQGLALLQFAHDQGHRARTLDWLAGLRSAGHLEMRQFTLALYGLSADRSKIFLWRAEHLPLPEAYLTNGDLITEIGRCIQAAEAAAGAIRRATRQMAGEALEPEGQPDPARVTALTDALAPVRTYWPRLDEPFRRLVIDLAETYSADGGTRAIEEWAAAIRTSAVEAFERAASALETSSRGYRAAALARPLLLGLLNKALAPLTPELQEAPA